MAKRASPPGLHRMRLGAVMTAVLMVAACSATSPASPPPSVVATSAPATTAVATSPPPEPSLSSSPGELALAALADPQAELHADYVGTLDRATTAGTYDQAGHDFHTVLTTTLDGVSFTVEQVVADDQTFILNPGRPWLHDPVVSGANRAPTLSQALEFVALRSAGSAEIEGVNTEQYELAGTEFSDLTASMGLSDPGATLTDTSAYLFASSDGKPVALTLTFKSPSPDGTVHASDYAFAFGPGPTPVSIDAPADPWIRKADGHGYRMWYPEAWRANPVDENAGGFTEDYFGPGVGVRVTFNPTANLQLKQWAADGQAFYTKSFGGKPDEVGSDTFNGSPGRWSRWEHGTIDGGEVFIVNVAMVKGPVGCDVQWYRTPGTNGDQDAQFTSLLATFAID